MAADQVPGVSIAVIHNGAIEWRRVSASRSWGSRGSRPRPCFKPEASANRSPRWLRFVSLSKAGCRSLRTSIRPHLVEDSAERGCDGSCGHAGRAPHPHRGAYGAWFSSYAAGAPIPTLVQILNGEKPANTGSIRLEATPSCRWNYSGGGYTVMHQLLLDVSQQPIPKLLRDTVLAPIGMTRSTYEQPLPEMLRSGAATPYRDNGTPVAGGVPHLSRNGSGGPLDDADRLARFAIEIQRSLCGDANQVLSADAGEWAAPGAGRQSADSQSFRNRNASSSLKSSMPSWGSSERRMGKSPIWSSASRGRVRRRGHLQLKASRNNCCRRSSGWSYACRER
jgi:hypothetical protein